MTASSSSDLVKVITSAGIKYFPADQIFYKQFPYKIELLPKHVGVPVQQKVGCQIDVRNAKKAREELIKFNNRAMRHIENTEHRDAILHYIKRLPDAQYKKRLGGTNSLYYFKDPALVMLVLDKFGSIIKSVTGPLNSTHESAVAKKDNIVIRDTLYYDKFRYQIQFDCSEKFATDVFGELKGALDALRGETWRGRKIGAMQDFCDNPQNMIPNPSNLAHYTNATSMPSHVALYFTDLNDFIYCKLMGAEHVVSSYEVQLFSELV